MSDEHTASQAVLSFAERLVLLRTKAGLSQARLAKAAKLRRHALARWEAGDALPQAASLQRLIAALLAHEAFVRGTEADEAQALWEQANSEGLRQLPFFDTAWFAGVIAQALPASLHLPPSIDWGGTAHNLALFGRERELAQLDRWLLDESCQVVGIFGVAGIGKTALALQFAHTSGERFEAVMVRSLHNALSLDALLDGLLQPFDPNKAGNHGLIDGKLAQLLALLREHRCLIVLDDVEAIMRPGAGLGQYRVGYADYGRLIRFIAESTHQSTLMVISRERPQDFWLLEQQMAVVHSLTLHELAFPACRDLLIDIGLHGEIEDWRTFVERYRGNPLILQLAAETVRRTPQGNLARFLAQAEPLPESIRALLTGQIERASGLEQLILTWLAIEWEPATVQRLREDIACPLANPQLPQALEALVQRRLVERARDGAFSLQPILQACLIELLVELVADQLVAGKLDLVCSYALVQGAAKEYLRDAQLQLIVQPILARVRAQVGSTDALSLLLLTCLNRLRALPSEQQRYGASNLALLLTQVRGDLRGVDLSNLSFWRMNLAGIPMQDADLRGVRALQPIFTEQLSSIYTSDASPDGSYLAAGSQLGVVHIWRATDLSQVAIIEAHSSSILQVAFRPDSTAIASASWDGSVAVWSIPDGALLARLSVPDVQMWSVAWEPDGGALWCSADDGLIRRWPCTSGAATRILEPPLSGIIPKLALSPDGATLAGGLPNGDICLWDVANLRVRALLHGHTSIARALAWHPSGRMLASSGRDYRIMLWDSRRGEQRSAFDSNTAVVWSLSWSRDGELLASAGGDGLVRVWEVEQGRCRLVLSGHAGAVFGVAFAAAEAAIISSGEDQTLRVWDTTTGQRRATLRGHTSMVNALAWHPNGHIIAVGTSNQLVTLWDVPAERSRESLPLSTNASQSLSFSADGTWLAAAGHDAVVRLRRIDGAEQKALYGHAGQVTTVAMHPHNLELASAGYDGRIIVWDVVDGIPRMQLTHAQQILWAVAWHPHKELVASAAIDGTVSVWDVVRGRQLHRLSGHKTCACCVTFSPNGALLASGDVHGLVLVWDWEREMLISRLATDSTHARSVAFSPDGAILASGSEDGVTRLWNVARGEPYGTLTSGTGAVRAIIWSADGNRLATGGSGGWVTVWDVRELRERQRFRGDRLYERMRIAGLTGISYAQRLALLALGADDSA